MKLLYTLCICALAVSAHAEMRVWTMESGQTVEGEFVALVGGKLTLAKPNGRQFKFPARELSKDDRSHLQLLMPPKLEINFSKSTEARVFPDTHSNEGLPRSMYLDSAGTIKQTSSQPYDHELTCELFVIAEEIDGDKRILSDYQRETFHLTEGSRSTFTIKARRLELPDYIIAGQRRGKRFSGHLIIVTDSRGEVIAYDTSSENLYEIVENLRKLPVGKTFDSEGNRCLPTRPKRFY
jgi:hypothetical protein